MRHNPLVAPILHILKQADAPCSLYGLLKQVEALAGDIDVLTDHYQLALFRKNFLVMNALYQLQDELFAEGVHVHISSLDIHLQPLPVAGASYPDLAGETRLREYYRDWRHYDETGDTDVQELLDGFWQRYAAHDRRSQALRILHLADDSDWSMIRAGYRRLAMQHHPDKGGDQYRFMEVREAYEILRCCYERA